MDTNFAKGLGDRVELLEYQVRSSGHSTPRSSRGSSQLKPSLAAAPAAWLFRLAHMGGLSCRAVTHKQQRGWGNQLAGKPSLAAARSC